MRMYKILITDKHNVFYNRFAEVIYLSEIPNYFEVSVDNEIIYLKRENFETVDSMIEMSLGDGKYLITQEEFKLINNIKKRTLECTI